MQPACHGRRRGKLKNDPLLQVLFRLARDLGCTVADLQQRVTWIEFLHWVQFYLLEARQMSLAVKGKSQAVADTVVPAAKVPDFVDRWARAQRHQRGRRE